MRLILKSDLGIIIIANLTLACLALSWSSSGGTLTSQDKKQRSLIRGFHWDWSLDDKSNLNLNPRKRLVCFCGYALTRHEANTIPNIFVRCPYLRLEPRLSLFPKALFFCIVSLEVIMCGYRRSLFLFYVSIRQKYIQRPKQFIKLKAL